MAKKLKAITFYYDPDDGEVTSYEFSEKFILEDGVTVAQILKDIASISNELYKGIEKEIADKFTKVFFKNSIKKGRRQ